MPMKSIETSVTISRPAEEIFAYLTDLRNAKDWNNEVIDVRYEGEITLGSTGSDTRKLGRKEVVMPWKVTAFDPPSRLVIEYEKPFPLTAEFSFQPVDSGTRLTCLTNLRPRGFWRLLAPALAREGKKADVVQFNKVKAILEDRS